MFKALSKFLFNVRGGVDDSDDYIAQRAEQIKKRASTNFLKQRKSSFFNFLLFLGLALGYVILQHSMERVISELNAQGLEPLRVVFMTSVLVFGKAQFILCLLLSLLYAVRYILLSQEGFTAREKEQINHLGCLATPLLILGTCFCIYISIDKATRYTETAMTVVAASYEQKHDIEVISKALDIPEWQEKAIANYLLARRMSAIYAPAIGDTKADALAFAKMDKDLSVLTECVEHSKSKATREESCKAELHAYAASKLAMNALNKGNRAVLKQSTLRWLMSLDDLQSRPQLISPHILTKESQKTGQTQ